MDLINNCLTSNNVEELNGEIVHNNDGSVSVYIPNQLGVLSPIQLTQPCCLGLNSNYIFDIDNQKCMWSQDTSGTCSTQAINLVINSTGNDGSIFQLNNNETCSLTIGFDYLFKFSCEKLTELLFPNANKIFSGENKIINKSKTNIDYLTVENETYQNKLTNLEEENSNTKYTIFCDTLTAATAPTFIVKTPITNSLTNFGNTGFNKVPNPLKEVIQPEPIQLLTVNYCLTEPLGLEAWSSIIGPMKYNDFLQGNPESYTANDVQKLIDQNLTTTPETNLFVESITPFGYKTQLINEINSLTQLINTNINLINYNDNIIEIVERNSVDICNTPTGVFEFLDVSVNVEVVNTDNTLTSVYTYPLFPMIGSGNLFSYLESHPDSGFYVCGESVIEPELGCKPMNLFSADNISTCVSLRSNIVNSLYEQSELSGLTNGLTLFKNALNENALASNWLTYTTTISDADVISQITNKKVKISLTINNNCTDICVLLDNIKMTQGCTVVDKTRIEITKSPGFNITRVRDNKKSWIDTTTNTNRVFSIATNDEEHYSRQTDYNVNDERLVINTKELDLNMNIATAIEHDVWCYLSDNECILTGTTHGCIHTCGDTIPFDTILSTNMSGITTIENFDNIISSELINAKTRKTIPAYATLKALYDRYLNSVKYCGNNSSAFNYMDMDSFTQLVGNYWVDIIEQMIPATTIWGSIKIYTNTIFDAQKFKYRTNTTFINNTNPFSGILTPSPINGVVGQCDKVSVIYSDIEPIQFQDQGIKQKPIIYTSPQVCISQYNTGSEFIGTVNEI